MNLASQSLFFFGEGRAVAPAAATGIVRWFHRPCALIATLSSSLAAIRYRSIAIWHKIIDNLAERE
jgi:hypothetical protein